ncbi:MAG TPA: ferredoxin family protein [Anaerolineae bacterium]|nr:ferredoxin family protein [Anaerolineae bacterium]
MNKPPTFWSSLWEHVEIARTLRSLRLYFDPQMCTGIWECYEVCPVGCWSRDLERGIAVLEKPEACIACGACVLQCPEEAIELR